MLQRTIPLRSEVSLWAADQDGTCCAVLFEPTETTREMIQVWNLQTGICQGILESDEADYLVHGAVIYIDLNAQFLSIERDDFAEIRYISRDCSSKAGFPLVRNTCSQVYWRVIGVSLLSPGFVAEMIVLVGDASNPPLLRIQFHRLERSTSRLVATFFMPAPRHRGPVDHIAAGADIVPGQEGLVVIIVQGDIVSQEGVELNHL